MMGTRPKATFRPHPMSSPMLPSPRNGGTRGMTMEIDLPHLSSEKDRHGNTRLYVRRHGRRIRLRMAPDAQGFVAAYQAALDRLKAPVARHTPTPAAKWPKGSFGELAVAYVASEEFQGLDPISRRT